MRARRRGTFNKAGRRKRWRLEDDWPSVCFPAETPWLAALAGLKHPFPSRTRPLRAPAAMILRSGARESSALPTSFSQPRATRSRGAFSLMRKSPAGDARALKGRAVRTTPGMRQTARARLPRPPGDLALQAPWCLKPRSRKAPRSASLRRAIIVLKARSNRFWALPAPRCGELGKGFFEKHYRRLFPEGMVRHVHVAPLLIQCL